MWYDFNETTIQQSSNEDSGVATINPTTHLHAQTKLPKKILLKYHNSQKKKKEWD